MDEISQLINQIDRFKTSFKGVLFDCLAKSLRESCDFFCRIELFFGRIVSVRKTDARGRVKMREIYKLQNLKSIIFFSRNEYNTKIKN